MAVGLSAAYDWANRPQDCLRVLGEALNENDEFLPGYEETSRVALNALAEYLKAFDAVTSTRVLTYKKFYFYTEQLQSIDQTIAELSTNINYMACALTSKDVEITEDTTQIPTNVQLWVSDPKFAPHVVSFLKVAVEQLEEIKSAPDLKLRIVDFYKEIQAHVFKINYIFKNPEIVAKASSPDGMNNFFNTVMKVNQKLDLISLDTMEKLYFATNQSPELIEMHNTVMRSPGPLKNQDVNTMSPLRKLAYEASRKAQERKQPSSPSLTRAHSSPAPTTTTSIASVASPTVLKSDALPHHEPAQKPVVESRKNPVVIITGIALLALATVFLYPKIRQRMNAQHTINN